GDGRRLAVESGMNVATQTQRFALGMHFARRPAPAAHHAARLLAEEDFVRLSMLVLGARPIRAEFALESDLILTPGVACQPVGVMARLGGTGARALQSEPRRFRLRTGNGGRQRLR